MAQNLDTKKEETKPDKGYVAEGEEKKVLDHLQKRIPILKSGKKKILDDVDFEEIMKEADKEYRPQSLREKKDTSSVMLIQDEIKGMRGSRIVPITGKEGQEWRSNVSEPTLLVKIQTAISILVDQNPEAVFKALLDKYKPTSSIAQAIWKRSWSIAKSKDQLKTFIFNLAKYGWAPGRTYPRLVQREKEILTELDLDNPENNKYKKVTVTEFNDVYREALDPWRTWIDDMANLYDPFSMDDWYFEKDFSKDTFDLEFGSYSNANFVKAKQKQPDAESSNVEVDNANEETKKRDDIITLGFYESKNKDLYAIYSPSDKVVVYYSPLPNDDGKLTLWDAYWNMRDPRTRYGIGLYEILKNDKVMYDRLDNMSMDQLVLAIYTMLFFSGSNQQVGDGTITVSPGLMKQKLPGTTVDQIKIDFKPEVFDGIDRRRERMDENTGITPTLQGQVEGKTLGEVLHAKDAALKRLNIPLANIASALEDDAYLTLSWANQLYSLPEVQEFVNEEDLNSFISENGVQPTRTVADEKTGVITADFPKVLDLGLAEDRDGALIEAPENRFFLVGGQGKDGLEKKKIRWKGQITVNAQSIIAPNQELDRQRKLELFNMVEPVVQAMMMAMGTGQFKAALAMAKPVVQILEIQNEEPKNWLPDEVVQLIEHPEMVDKLMQAAAAGAQAGQAEAAQAENDAKPLFVGPDGKPTPEQAAAAPAGPATGGGNIPPGTPPPPSSQGPGIPGVVPRGQITNPVRKTMTEVGKVGGGPRTL